MNEQELNNNPLFKMLKDKKELIKFLFQTIERSNKYANGLRLMKERGFSQEGMLDKCIEITAIQSEEILRLAFICLVYSQGDHFSGDLAKMMMKLGADGNEVLRAMWQSKFGNI